MRCPSCTWWSRLVVWQEEKGWPQPPCPLCGQRLVPYHAEEGVDDA